jgi:hypothetical protein
VENPGNPESIIFRDEESVIFTGIAESIPEISLLVTSSKGESSMSDNNEQVRSLQAHVETLEARLRELDEEKVKAQITAFKTACADKDVEITELKTKIEAANQAIEASSKDAEELESLKAASEQKIAELGEKLDAIEAQNLKTSRVSALVDKGVDKANAETLVETFADISDEQFNALVELTEAPHWPGHKGGDDEKKKKDKKDEDKKEDANMKKKYGEKADVEAEETAEAENEAEANEALEGAEAEETPALAAHSEDETVEVIASLNEYFSGVLGGTNNEKES